MDSSSNHQPAPRRRKLATSWLWIIIGICVLVLVWVVSRPPAPAAQPVTLFEMSNQSAGLHYQTAPHFLASGTVQIEYSVASCRHDVAAGWDVWMSLI